MNSPILSVANANQYGWGDNCQGWNFLDTDELSVKQELMPPGTAELLHFHKYAQQFFYILSGEATFWIEGQTFVVRSNQGILITPGVKHRIANYKEEDLSFVLTSQPSTKNDRFNCEENE